jgi:hypothetical protein
MDLIFYFHDTFSLCLVVFEIINQKRSYDIFELYIQQSVMALRT